MILTLKSSANNSTSKNIDNKNFNNSLMTFVNWFGLVLYNIHLNPVHVLPRCLFSVGKSS